MDLRKECLRHVPLTFETVEDIYKGRRDYSESELAGVIRALCRSHERLRAELEGAEQLLRELDTRTR